MISLGTKENKTHQVDVMKRRDFLKKAGMGSTAALILESGQIIGVEPPFPAIKRLWRYIEVAAGQTGVSVLGIMVHPLQSRCCNRGDRPLPDQ